MFPASSSVSQRRNRNWGSCPVFSDVFKGGYTRGCRMVLKKSGVQRSVVSPSHSAETRCKNSDADYCRSVDSITAAAFRLSTPPENY